MSDKTLSDVEAGGDLAQVHISSGVIVCGMSASCETAAESSRRMSFDALQSGSLS